MEFSTSTDEDEGPGWVDAAVVDSLFSDHAPLDNRNKILWSEPAPRDLITQKRLRCIHMFVIPLLGGLNTLSSKKEQWCHVNELKPFCSEAAAITRPPICW